MNRGLIKRDSLSKQISDKLEIMIEEGTYQIGEKIPTEPELMEMFSVSRNTVREAIQSLTWAGILEVKQGDGTYVRSSSRFRANMKKRYDKTSLEQINEARKLVEVNFAHLAAKRRTEEDLKAIKAALERRNNLTSDIKENTKADLEFHMEIAKACHNEIVIDLYHSISDYLEEHIAERNLDSKLSSEEIDKLHERLYEAILDSNSDEAREATLAILNI